MIWVCYRWPTLMIKALARIDLRRWRSSVNSKFDDWWDSWNVSTHIFCALFTFSNFGLRTRAYRNFQRIHDTVRCNLSKYGDAGRLFNRIADPNHQSEKKWWPCIHKRIRRSLVWIWRFNGIARSPDDFYFTYSKCANRLELQWSMSCNK